MAERQTTGEESQSRFAFIRNHHIVSFFGGLLGFLAFAQGVWSASSSEPLLVFLSKQFGLKWDFEMPIWVAWALILIGFGVLCYIGTGVYFIHRRSVAASPPDSAPRRIAAGDMQTQSALNYSSQGRLVWRRFPESEIPKPSRGNYRHTLIRAKNHPGGFTAHPGGGITVRFPNEVDFITGVPTKVNNDQCVSIKEIRAPQQRLESLARLGSP